jgi:DNA-binding MarR family transcriptional regulator
MTKQSPEKTARTPKPFISKYADLIMLIRKETRMATLFVQTVAETSGIHPTDIKCLDFLTEKKIATAGDLARITGLTTGAITSAIDRMEKAGFIERKADPKDRRKTLIQLRVSHPRHLQLVHHLFSDKLPAILDQYSAAEIELIVDWNKKMATALQEEILTLRSLKQKK